MRLTSFIVTDTTANCVTTCNIGSSAAYIHHEGLTKGQSAHFYPQTLRLNFERLEASSYNSCCDAFFYTARCSNTSMIQAFWDSTQCRLVITDVPSSSRSNRQYGRWGQQDPSKCGQLLLSKHRAISQNVRQHRCEHHKCCSEVFLRFVHTDNYGSKHKNNRLCRQKHAFVCGRYMFEQNLWGRTDRPTLRSFFPRELTGLRSN